MQSLILEFNYQQIPVYIVIDNYDILKLLIRQDEFQSSDLNKYICINYICEYMFLSCNNFTFVNYHEDKAFENFDINDSCDLIIDQYIIGKIGSINFQYLQQIKYALGLGSLKLPMVAGIRYVDEIIFNNSIIKFKCEDNLYVPSYGDIYCKLDVNYNSQAYSLYCSKYELHAILTQLGVDYNLHGDSNDVLPHKIIIERVTISSKIKHQYYLPIVIEVCGFSIVVLLNKWHNIKSNLLQNQLKNDLAKIMLPIPLVHGIAKVSLEEINTLELGDIILFDESHAPQYAISDFGGYVAMFEVIDDAKLKFKRFMVRGN